MEAFYATLGLVLVSLITGAVTWMVARRTKSGKIDTSEASQLWDEGTAMRVELRVQVATLQEKLAEAIKAVSALNEEIRMSRSETASAQEETRLSRIEIRRLMAKLNDLHEEVKTSNALTIGALADNTETRRILEIPREERTDVEKQHLATANQRLPQGDRPIIPKTDRDEKDG